MPKNYFPLPTAILQAQMSYVHPVELPRVIHWDDPAELAMVNFKYMKAEAIGLDDAIDVALLAIKKCDYHVLLVVDADHHVLGYVSAEDLLGEKPLKVIQEKRAARSEITIGMVMVPQQEIFTIDIENLHHAKVGHIVETLQFNKQHFMLVTDSAHGTICGLFSISLMGRQLGRNLVDGLQEAPITELPHNLHVND